MKKIEHPSLWLDDTIVAAIRATAAESETLRQLHPQQLRLIHEQRWLRMFVPTNLGGLGLSLPEVLKTEEALAWTDGSVAWVVTLCAGAAWFVGFLDTELTKIVLSDQNFFFAGSGATTGSAESISNGYLLNGIWKHASGALHANVFTANFVVHDNGKSVIKPFLMKKNEVTIHHTWNSVGMVATGSHSFEVKNLVVPTNRIFEIDRRKAVIKAPIYRYPFLQLAETTLAVNLSGLAIRFIDLAEEIIQLKKGADERSLKLTRRSRTKLNEYREKFYDSINSSWRSCAKKREIPGSLLKNVSRSSQALARQSLRIVDGVYPHCGLAAADQALEINRVWRNIHTASQHSLFRH